MLFLHCRLALDLVQHNASVMRTMRRAYGHTSICKARAAQEQTLNPKPFWSRNCAAPSGRGRLQN